MTHEEFAEAIEPSRLARAEVAALEERQVEAIVRGMRVDAASRKVLRRMARCVRADKDLGENSELYTAIRYGLRY